MIHNLFQKGPLRKNLALPTICSTSPKLPVSLKLPKKTHTHGKMEPGRELLEAVEVGNIDKVRELLDSNVNKDMKNAALLLASEKGHHEIVELLIDKGADMNTTNKFRFTPLTQAIRSGSLATVKVLLDKGVNVESYWLYAAMTRASKDGHTDIIALVKSKIGSTEPVPNTTSQNKLLKTLEVPEMQLTGWPCVYTFLDDHFFKYLFFDPYAGIENGANPYVVANRFSRYLKNVTDETNTSVLELFQEQYGTYDISNWQILGNPTQRLYTEEDENYLIESCWTRQLVEKGHIIILSGYMTDVGGHAVTLYINLAEDGKYNVYVINSGEGLQYHCKGSMKVDDKRPIVILYENVLLDQVINLFRLHIFFTKVFNNRDKIIADWKSCIETQSYSAKYQTDKFAYVNRKDPIADSESKSSHTFSESKSYDYHKQYLFPNFFWDHVRPSMYAPDQGIDIYIFYKSLNSVLNRPFRPIVMDTPQISHSCSFYSIYYFLKYFVFQYFIPKPSTSIVSNLSASNSSASSSNTSNSLAYTLSTYNYYCKIADKLTDAHNVALQNNNNHDHSSFNTFIDTIKKTESDAFFQTMFVRIPITTDFRHRMSLLNITHMLLKDTSCTNRLQIETTLVNIYMDNSLGIYGGLPDINDTLEDTIKFYKEFCETPNKTFSMIQSIFPNIKLIGITIKKNNGGHIVARHVMLLKCLLNLLESIEPYKPITPDTNFSDDPNFDTMTNILSEIHDGLHYSRTYGLMNLVVQCFLKQYKIESSTEIPLETRVTIYNTPYYDEELNALFNHLHFFSTNSIVLYGLDYRRLYTQLWKVRGLFFKDGMNRLQDGLVNKRCKLIYYIYNMTTKSEFYLNFHIENLTQKKISPTLDKRNQYLNSGYRYEYIIRMINNNSASKLKDVNIPFDGLTNYTLTELVLNNTQQVTYTEAFRPNYTTISRDDYTFYKIETSTFLDVFNIIETLDLEKFMAQLNFIPMGMLELIVFTLFLVRKKFTSIESFFNNNSNCEKLKNSLGSTSFMTYILEKNYRLAFMKYQRYERYSNEAPLYINSMFANLFMTNSLEEDMEFLTQLVPLDCEVKPGYSIELDKALRFQLGNFFTLYRSISTSSLFYGMADGSLVPLVEQDGKVGRTLNTGIGKEGETAWFTPLDIANQTFAFLTTKLTYSGIRFQTLKSSTNYYVCPNSFSEYFRIDAKTFDIYFYDTKGTEYKVLINPPNVILGTWVYQTTNAFLLQNRTSYSLLLFITQNYIQNDLYNHITSDTYWLSIPKDKLNSVVMKHQEALHILPFHHTLTTLDTRDYNDLAAAYLTFGIARNALALHIMYPIFRNFVLSGSVPDDPMYKFTEEIGFDVPLWPLYKKMDSQREKYFQMRKADNGPYSLKSLEADDQYQTLVTLFNAFKIAKSPINSSNLNTTANANLIGFLEKFRYRCLVEQSTVISSQVRTIKSQYLPFSEEILFPIFQSMLWKDFKWSSIPNIYSRNYIEFYKNVINLLYSEISRNVASLKEEELACVGESCGIVLKLLQPLDPNLILPFDIWRDTEDMLFELQKRLFLRASQKTTLENIYLSLDDNKTDAYEILMGAGKTSTITPITILRTSLHAPVQQSIVCLPAHLVSQSFDILSDLATLIPNVPIIKADTQLPLVPCICVVNDNTFKKSILTRIRDGNPFELPLSNLVLFDEVDSLLNPMKSDLNIPSLSQDHPNLKIISSICIELMENVFSGISVEDKTDNNIRIKHPFTNVLLYGGTSQEPELARVLERKLNDTLSQVLTLRYNQSYGFGIKKNYTLTNLINQKEMFVAIPYTANINPAYGSEFTDFELSVLLTIASYHQSSIRKEDIYMLLQNIHETITQFDSINAFASNIETLVIDTYFKSIRDIFGMESIFQVLSLFKKNRHTDALRFCEGLASSKVTASNKNNFLRVYLNTIVFKYFFKIMRKQDNISMVDLFDPSISKKKISFSGTVNFNTPVSILKSGDFFIPLSSSSAASSSATADYFPPVPEEFSKGQLETINADTEVGVSIKAAFFGKTTHTPMLHIYKSGTANELETTLLTTLRVLLATPETQYQALIDTAGLILFATPIQVMELVRTVLPDHTLLFIENGVRKIYGNKESPPVLYDGSTRDKLFIYYDHKNCVGADFKQPHTMRGLVTVSAKNNLTEISQGIFRLRNINVGQWVDFYLPENYIEGLTNSSLGNKKATMVDCRHLYTKLLDADKQFKTSTLSTAKVQVAKYVHRIASEHTKASYREDIFFDAIDLDLTVQTFTDTLLDTYTGNLHSKASYKDLTFKHIDMNTAQLSQKQHVALQQSVNQQIVTSIVSNVAVNKMTGVFTHDFGELPPMLTIPQEYCYIDNTLIPASWIFNGKTLTSLLQVHCSSDIWTFYLSNVLMRDMKKRYDNLGQDNSKRDRFNFPDNNCGINEHTYFMNYGIYAMVNPEEPYKVLLLNYPELYSFRSFLKLYPDICLSAITVFDPLGNHCFGAPMDENPLPPELKVLLYPMVLKPVKTFHYLKQLYATNEDARQKIDFFREALFITNQLTLAIPGKWEFSATTEWNDFSNWEYLYGFSIDATRDTKGVSTALEKTILDEYRTTFPEDVGTGRVTPGTNNDVYESDGGYRKTRRARGKRNHSRKHGTIRYTHGRFRR